MADVILYGGNIVTMDEARPLSSGKVEAVAISGDTIIEVGDLEQVFDRKGPNTEVIFLNQQTLMPGFIEPHQHAIMCSQMRCVYINISALNYGSYAEIRKVMTDRIAELVDDPEKKWALFFGWDPELISDLPTLSAAFLDKNFSSEVPIGVVGQSGHVAWVNNPALLAAAVNDSSPDPPGGTIVKDENGHVTGQLFEDAAIMGVIDHAPMPTAEQLQTAIMEQWKYYASVGFTTVTDLGYLPNKEFDYMLQKISDDENEPCPIRLGLYRIEHPQTDFDPADKQTKLTPREAYQHLCCPRLIKMPTVQNDESLQNEEYNGIGNYNGKLWLAGIKLIADGSPHCGTAAVHEPFLNKPIMETLGFPPAPVYGHLNYATDAFVDTITKFHEDGKQVAVHCHGERANEQILKVYEQILQADDDLSNKNRHRMEHCGFMTVEQIARAGKANVALSFFVDHLRFYASIYKTDLFGEKVNRWTPLSEATRSGVTWTIHQDHPTFPGEANPFSNMKTAITRCQRDDPDHPYGPEYRVPIHETLKSYTVNAAWQLQLEKEVGSISVGKKADLVVLSDNPYQMDPFKLEDIQVVETFLNGRRNNLSKVTETPLGFNVMKRDTTASK